jgi:Adenylate and Guanylate cyclase catalytic domain
MNDAPSPLCRRGDTRPVAHDTVRHRDLSSRRLFSWPARSNIVARLGTPAGHSEAAMDESASHRWSGRLGAPPTVADRDGLGPKPPAARTVAFLFCDMVGSTDFMARRGLAVSEELRRRVFAALREAIRTNAGEEVKTTGDGLMVAFPSAASDAVACAISMQRAVARLSLEQPRRPTRRPIGTAYAWSSRHASALLPEPARSWSAPTSFRRYDASHRR